MSNYHFGDKVNQYGNQNIGVIKNQGSVDARTAFREMINAVEALRDQVSTPHRQIIDQSMSIIGAGDNVEKKSLLQALGNIAEIAKMVGQVGAPVIESIRKVIAAVGM